MTEQHSPTSHRVVLLQEVGPRDGLQNEGRVLDPAVRSRLIEALGQAGLPRVQIGSFVSPRRVPQMAGTDLVWQGLRKRSGVRYSVLVLNERGLDLAVAERVPHLEIYVSASETHSLKNSGMSVKTATDSAARMIRRAGEEGLGVTAGVMCAFGCFYEGPVSVARVVDIIERFEAFPPSELSLADTTGMGDPSSVGAVVHTVAELVGVERLAMHLHDTRGFGPANLRACLDAGVRRFDVAVGGLGGCPFIPGAKGNISTEGTVTLLESLGYVTGVATERVAGVRKDLEILLKRGLNGGGAG